MKKKILMLSPELKAVSGVSTHANMILNSALKNEFSFYHFKIGSEGKKKGLLKHFQELLSDPARFYFFSKKIKPNIVHINTSVNLKAISRDIFFLLISKILKIKVICQIHGGKLPSNLPRFSFLKLIFHILINSTDLIIVLNSTELAEYKKYFPKCQIKIIPNAIPKIDESKNKYKPKKIINLIYFGRFIKNKGVFDIVEAIKTLKESNINFKFLFMGSGESEFELKNMINNYKLQSNTIFMDKINDDKKFVLIKKSDLFIFPTYHQEGMPYSIIESMACGVPTITCKIPGTKDLIQNHKNGLFVAPRNPKSLSKCIIKITQNPMKLNLMKENSKRIYQKKFSESIFVENFKKVFTDLTK